MTNISLDSDLFEKKRKEKKSWSSVMWSGNFFWFWTQYQGSPVIFAIGKEMSSENTLER